MKKEYMQLYSPGMGQPKLKAIQVDGAEIKYFQDQYEITEQEFYELLKNAKSNPDFSETKEIRIVDDAGKEISNVSYHSNDSRSRMSAKIKVGDENFEYEYLCLEIPVGWRKLFLQMCGDIKPLLEQEGVMDDFYFIQVKEKYNELRCYSNGAASSKVEVILQKYEYLSRFVCTECGNPATYETRGYIASYCEDCWKDIVRHEKVDKLEFISTYEVVGFKNGKSYSRIVDVEDEWNRYLKENGYEEGIYTL
jgi:hypothetical protein